MATSLVDQRQDKLMEGDSEDKDNGCNTNHRQAPMQERYRVHDGYEVCFAKPPPDEIQIECCICLEFLCDPCLVDCECGNSFCRTCIEAVRNRNRLCPLCNSKFTIILPSKQLRRIHNGLHVHCPNMDQDCNWTNELGKLSEHLNTNPSVENRLQGCGYIAAKCALCPEYHQRRALLYHESRLCPERLYTCEYCNGYSSTFRDVYSNHWPLCVGFHTVCQSSGFRVRSETKQLVDPPVQKGGGSEGQSPAESIVNQCSDVPNGCDLLYCGQLMRKNTQVEADSTSEICTLSLRQPETQEAEPIQRQRLNGSQIPLTMNNVSGYKEPEDVWYTQPFHTHLHGYNMCLGVQLNDNRGGYLSINVHLLKGKFDHELPWPFQGEVTIKLLSQGSDRHHNVTVEYTECTSNEYAGRRYKDDEKGAGLGKPNFIACRCLYPTFLINDNLQFEIHSVVYI